VLGFALLLVDERNYSCPPFDDAGSTSIPRRHDLRAMLTIENAEFSIGIWETANGPGVGETASDRRA
jgi:hypothetical protein